MHIVSMFSETFIPVFLYYLQSIFIHLITTYFINTFVIATVHIPLICICYMQCQIELFSLHCMLQKQQTAYKSASVTCSPTHRVSPALFGMPVPAHTLQIPALPSLGWNIMASTIISLCVHVCAQSPSRVQLRSHMDSRPPGFSVHGIFQGRILEWVAISFSRRFSQLRD